MRKIYHLRSRLMPYIYSLSYMGYEQGVPMISAMYLEHPDDENAYRNPQQYFFGGAFLCAPVTEPMKNGVAPQKIWIPDGIYYHFFTEEKFSAGDHVIDSPLDEFPLLVRAGVPIPMQAYKSRMTERSCGFFFYLLGMTLPFSTVNSPIPASAMMRTRAVWRTKPSSTIFSLRTPEARM